MKSKNELFKLMVWAMHDSCISKSNDPKEKLSAIHVCQVLSKIGHETVEPELFSAVSHLLSSVSDKGWESVLFDKEDNMIVASAMDANDQLHYYEFENTKQEFFMFFIKFMFNRNEQLEPAI